MTYFRDHADAMRVINATFAGHALFDQPCQSWMVRRVVVPETGEALPAATTDIVTTSAYHFVVTWLPGRALIVTGDIGSAVYSGITHLSSLDETVRLVREAEMDYLSRKSTHKREFDASETVRNIVSRAYRVARRYRDFDWFKEIIEWADLPLCDRNDPELCHEDRKAACRELLGSELDESTIYAEFEDVDCAMSWPHAAHWHYEALRAWANLMTRQKIEAAKRTAAEAKRQTETATP